MQENKVVQKNKLVDLLIFILFLNVFFFHNLGTVALALFLTGGYILAGRIFNKFEPVVSAIFGINVLTLFLVNSPEKIALLSIMSVAIILVTIYLGLKRAEIGGILELTLSSLVVVREYARSGLMIIGSTLRGNLRRVLQLDKVQKERSPWIRSIGVGIIVGLPLVAWLVLTLAKADPVFALFIKNLVSEKFLTELPGRLIMSGMALLFLMPALLMQWRGYVSPLSWISRVRFGREMSVILMMVVVILALFLAVQWPYVFASVARETDLSKYGVATYSEYVTRGFWDLVKVAAMVFGVSWITLLIAKNQKGNERKILMWMQAVLGVEFVIFIISIFRRVWLYQSYHGLTLARLYGLVILIWVVGMMVTMALRYFDQKIRWVKVEVAWLGIVILGSIGMNMEGLVVKDPPTVNGRVDYVYLSRLPGDGYEGWKQAFDNTQEKLDKLVSAKPVGIGVDPRREVFYGSLVLGELIDNYDKLVWQYGSEDEVKAYLRQVIDWEEAMLIKYPEIATSQVSGGSEQVRRKMSEARRMIEGADWGKTGIVVRGRSHYFDKTYTFSGVDAGFYGLQTGEKTENRRLAKFDSFLSYNWKDQRVYEQMKRDMPIEQILKTVENYWILRLQIITQPATERAVEIDLSFDSPFMR